MMSDAFANALKWADDDSVRIGMIAATLMVWSEQGVPMPPEEAKRIAQAILDRNDTDNEED